MNGTNDRIDWSMFIGMVHHLPEGEYVCPNGAVTYQPRATPWESYGTNRASPERAKQGHYPCYVPPLQGFDYQDAFDSQGVALGWPVAAPSGQMIDNRKTRIDNFRLLHFRLLLSLLLLFVLTPRTRSQDGFDHAFQTASDRVVKLYGLGAGAQVGYGSGVLISRDGLVLTVFSLLVDARTVRVVTANGARFEADVLHRDAARQLALLKLRKPRPPDTPVPVTTPAGGIGSDAEPVGPFPYFDLGIPESGDAAEAATAPVCATNLALGDWVVAAGNPFKVADGAEPASIAHGVYSTRTRLDARRRVRDFPYTGDVLVIDAITSNPGGDGGAVVNLDGEFVGLIGRAVVSNFTHTHFNYALPCDVLREFLGDALGTEAPTHSEDSIATKNLDTGIKISRAGYKKVLPFVERVRKNSPADRAGVRADDLIMSVNGKAVADVDAYDERLKGIPPAAPIELVIRRDRKILTVRMEAEKE